MSSSTQKNMAVPADLALRNAIRSAVRDYSLAHPVVPPLSLEEIEARTVEIMQSAGMDASFFGFVAVLVGNEVWRDTLAAIPFSRRVLLLPRCVRSSHACKARSDDFGLLCESCGQCPIGDIQDEAEELGYVVLVAEGNTAVSALLAKGAVDAVVGVSCLSALEKSFRPLTAHAIPGMAVPLLRDGCVDTEVDLDWVREIVNLNNARQPAPVRVDMHKLRQEVQSWFQADDLSVLLGSHGTDTEKIALDWLAQDGKRWRPLICVCVCQALDASRHDMSDVLKHIAIAVECFHKASLVHDDIEDEDESRYGKPTLHKQHGLAVALNAGDLLIGEGYRMIAESGASSAQISRMLAVAAEGHKTLCLGQGEEFLLRADPGSLTPEGVLEIFRRKTAPAFEVALQLGAICANADEETRAALSAFSGALGIAYQIRDDLEDFATDHGNTLHTAFRPSLLMAVAYEELKQRGKAVAQSLTQEQIHETGAEHRVRRMFEDYEKQTLQALRPLRHVALKSLLYRLVAKILTPPS